MSKPSLITNIESRTLRAGDSMTGSLLLKGNPTQALEAATKQYVDGGSVSSAAQLTTARTFAIADNDGTNVGPTASFNGTANTIINLPSTIKASLSGNATTSSSCTGNAATATKLVATRTISLTGDVTGSGTFDGSGDLSITTAVANNSHTHSFTVYGGNHTETASGTTANTPTAGMLYTNGLYATGTYNDANTPINYGNIINVAGAGTGQLLLEWKGTDSTTGGIYYRSHRDTSTGGWGAWRQVWLSGDSVTGAVWNDYAEYRESDVIEPGYCLIENGDDTLSKSTERMQAWAGISSDTWGFAQGQTEKAQTPIAVAGRVLVYPYRDRKEYKSGDCVCTAPDGKVDIMTEEEIYRHPDKIIGVVSCIPDYDEWGGGENADRPSVKVDGRIWVRVK